MTKSQAIYQFWSGFRLTAYDENSVPDNATLPYVTYSFASDSFENQLSLGASLWYDSDKWTEITAKAEEISASIGRYFITPIDGGYLMITRGTPFAQRMFAGGRTKRMLLSVQIEYFTNT